MGADKALRNERDQGALAELDPVQAKDGGAGNPGALNESKGWQKLDYAGGGAKRAAADDFMQVGRTGSLMNAMQQIKLAPTEHTVHAQLAAIDSKFSGTELANSLPFLLENYKKVCLGDAAALGYFETNMSWAHSTLGQQGFREVMGLARSSETAIGRMAGAATNLPKNSHENLQRNDTPKREKIPTPRLDHAITAIEAATKMPFPGVIHESFEAVKSALELARTSEQHGEDSEYHKHILALGGAVFKAVGEIVKACGQNAELAEQACAQLGKIGSFLGGAAKALGALENLSKVFAGKTLSGTPVDARERCDAGFELIVLAAGTTIGGAITLSKTEFVWVFNHIGVPIKQATEEAGLGSLFPGTSPEALTAKIQAMPIDGPHALATIRELHYHTFKPVKSMFSQMIMSDAWMKFLAEGRINADVMRQVNETAKDKVTGDDNVGTLRSSAAKEYQDAAVAFIAKQVQEAHRWQ